MVTSDVLNDRERYLKRTHEREVESMSKQSTRHHTRQEQRREEQRRREEERRRAARTKRITTISIIAVGVLAVAVLVYFVIAQGHTPANAAYPAVDNFSCQSTEQAGTHIHAHVTMYVNECACRPALYSDRKRYLPPGTQRWQVCGPAQSRNRQGQQQLARLPR